MDIVKKSEYRFIINIVMLFTLLINLNHVFAEQSLTISGAGFKSYSKQLISELNGCFSGVNYSYIVLPTNSTLNSVNINFTNSSTDSQVRILITKYNSSIWDGTYLVDKVININSNIYSETIPLNIPYTTHSHDSIVINYLSQGFDTVKLCGVTAYFKLATETMFIDSFE